MSADLFDEFDSPTASDKYDIFPTAPSAPIMQNAPSAPIMPQPVKTSDAELRKHYNILLDNYKNVLHEIYAMYAKSNCFKSPKYHKLQKEILEITSRLSKINTEIGLSRGGKSNKNRRKRKTTKRKTTRRKTTKRKTKSIITG